MRRLIPVTPDPSRAQPRFYSVSETAQILGVSEMTLYRAIRAARFPAVQIMGRLIIPAKVIDEIIDTAIASGSLVDTEDWTPAAASSDVTDQSRSQGTGERAIRGQHSVPASG